MTGTGEQYILVELGAVFMINHIKILLSDNGYSYSYYVEVSVDRTNWERVFDRTKNNCRGWQILHFPIRAVRFIKLVGTRSNDYYMSSESLYVVALEAYHTLINTQSSQLVDGIANKIH